MMPGEDRRVGQGAGGQHGAARDRQRAEPVDEPVLEVLGHGVAVPMPLNSTPVGMKPGTRKST